MSLFTFPLSYWTTTGLFKQLHKQTIPSYHLYSHESLHHSQKKNIVQTVSKTTLLFLSSLSLHSWPQKRAAVTWSLFHSLQTCT